jgi:hypothetical protein
VVSARAMPRSYKEDNWGNQVSCVSLRRKWSVSREPSFREGFSAEDEESPLLEAVVRERLVKTQQARKS